jgi:hypothetical protein
VIDTKVTSPKVVPSSFAIQLVELCSKPLWWFVIIYLLQAVVVLLVYLIHVFIIDFHIFEHNVVLLKALVKEFLSIFVRRIIELVLLLIVFEVSLIFGDFFKLFVKNLYQPLLLESFLDFVLIHHFDFVVPD